MMRMSLVFLILPLTSCQGAHPDRWVEDRILTERIEEYLGARHRFYPVEATQAGDHSHDAELGSFRPEALRGRLSWLHDFRQKLLGVDLTKLSRSSYVDALWLTSLVKAEIHELDAVAAWRKSPAFYGRLICAGATGLVSGEPSEPRITALLSRLRQVPSLLEEARSNMEAPSRVVLEEDLAELGRCRRILLGLPAVVGKTVTGKLIALGEQSREAAGALQELIRYIELRLLPQAPESFALGPETLRLRLLYQEMEDTPLATIRQLAEGELGKARSQMEEIARRLGPDRRLPRILADLTREQVSAPEVIAFTEAVLLRIHDFAAARDLTSGIGDRRIQVIETPPYLRDGFVATLHVPDPLEEDPRGAYLMLSLPEPGWPARRREAHLRSLTHDALQLAAMGEIYPGKYLQHIFRSQNGSRLRRLLISEANRKGWSRYVQQMLLEEGYDAQNLPLRLIRLHRWVMDLSRLVMAIRLHSQETSLGAAARFFQEQAFLTRQRAEKEARAVATHPDLLKAALGKLQILKLRQDYLHTAVSSGKLRDFHDAFLSAGVIPIRLVGLLLLANDQTTILDVEALR
ncbi:MAG: DUF885 family protein [Acidobacteriota bacterium]